MRDNRLGVIGFPAGSTSSPRSPTGRILTTNGACLDAVTATEPNEARGMVRALDTIHQMTFEEYLEFEETTEVRHDFVAGHLYAFAGSSARHNLIAGEIFRLLSNASDRSPYQIFTHAMKLRVSSSVTYYPDIMAACDPNDVHELYRSRPCVVVEVLSPSTALVDRREKLIAYQSIESLAGYFIVYRDQCRVESYTRNHDGIWDYQNLTNDQAVLFPCVDLTISVRALYAKVDMSPIDPSEDDQDTR
jgi:Uma2 family endonuclease